MKKNLRIILTLFLLFAAISCEQSIDYDLQYSPRIVVDAMLVAGKKLDSVLIYKTLPPLDDFTYEKAKITDAELIITSGSGEKYAGKYVSGVLYKLDKPLVPQSGEKYFLSVLWNGLHCSAETTIPDSAIINDFNLISGGEGSYQLQAVVIPNKYDCLYRSYYSDYGYNYYFDTKTLQDTAQNGLLYLTYYFIQSNISDSTGWREKLKGSSASVLTYDIQYLDYYLTRYDGELKNSFFSNQGKNVKWNVKGDGIGLFISYTISTKTL